MTSFDPSGSARALASENAPLDLFKDTPWPMGVTSTVYSMVWPETEALARQSLSEGVEELLDRHRQPWLKRQDPMHKDFFAAYERFAGPALNGGSSALDAFPHRYPCAGASEAIRESIHQLGVQAQKPAMIVFEGEYEGYEAMGAIDGLPIRKIRRENWREELEGLAKEGVKGSFFVSQPSAIDGSEWRELPAFLDALHSSFQGSVDARLDLTYVGATAELSPIPASHPVVSQIFFSLSKPFGCYYRRIGGCYSREPIPSLWGNGWFKNLDALSLGQKLLDSEPGPFARHERWAPLQRAAAEAASASLAPVLEAFGARLEPSDSLLICSVLFEDPKQAQRFDQERLSDTDSPARALARLACRGVGESPASRRLCLTPWMETLLRLTPEPAPSKTRKPSAR